MEVEPDGVEVLNGLLREEISAVDSYRLAREMIESRSIKQHLMECETSHTERIDLLRRRIISLGGRPDETHWPWGPFCRRVRAQRDQVGAGVAISSLEAGEDHELRHYRQDIGKLDGTSRKLVEAELLPAQQFTHSYMFAIKQMLQ